MVRIALFILVRVLWLLIFNLAGFRSLQLKKRHIPCPVKRHCPLLNISHFLSKTETSSESQLTGKREDLLLRMQQLYMSSYFCFGVSELKEEVVYYDVCEDPEELQSMAHAGIHQAESAAVRQLKRRLQTLETKRGSICARRAYLRNKKVWEKRRSASSFWLDLK